MLKVGMLLVVDTLHMVKNQEYVRSAILVQSILFLLSANTGKFSLRYIFSYPVLFYGSAVSL
jgi:hypothetical protein